ncbi:MAG: acyl-CoA dehydrogenase family protein, partial [Deltaproteobacteria bacterium]
TPLSKLCTARQAMAIVPEILEVFGGAGFIEDTGIPRLLRDAQVLPIWEGTTNVLSLDSLRAISQGGAFEALQAEVEAIARELRSPPLQRVGREAAEAVERSGAFLQQSLAKGAPALEAGARGVALTLARSYAAALLSRQAQWSIDHEKDGRSQASALRFARHGIDRLAPLDPSAAALADDQPLPL